MNNKPTDLEAIKPINRITLEGVLYFDTLYWNVWNKNNQNAFMVHLEVLSDTKNSEFQIVPIYVYSERLKHYLMNNTAINKERVIVNGSLGIARKSIIQYESVAKCSIILKDDEDSITRLDSIK